MGNDRYASYHTSYFIHIFDDTVIEDGQVATLKARSKIVLYDVVDAAIHEAIATNPAISSWAELSKVLHELMQILVIIGGSLVWVSFLVEPVKVNMPNSFVSQLPS